MVGASTGIGKGWTVYGDVIVEIERGDGLDTGMFRVTAEVYTGGDVAPVRGRVDLDFRRTMCSASAGFFWSSIGWDLSKGPWSRYASETWPSASEYCSYSERAWSRSSFPASVPEHSGGFRWNSRPACPTSCGRRWL